MEWERRFGPVEKSGYPRRRRLRPFLRTANAAHCTREAGSVRRGLREDAMEMVHTFRAKDGSGAGASTLKDGSNLPGGADAWVHQGSIDAKEMMAGAGVAGIGNAEAILDAVRRDSFVYVPNGGEMLAPLKPR